jgi:hypothetical protein
MTAILASFASPESISTTPYTLLWALPILLGISIIVKTIKPEKLEIPILIKESLKLFIGSTIVLIIIAVILGALLEYIN